MTELASVYFKHFCIILQVMDFFFENAFQSQDDDYAVS